MEVAAPTGALPFVPTATRGPSVLLLRRENGCRPLTSPPTSVSPLLQPAGRLLRPGGVVRQAGSPSPSRAPTQAVVCAGSGASAMVAPPGGGGEGGAAWGRWGGG